LTIFGARCALAAASRIDVALFRETGEIRFLPDVYGTEQIVGRMKMRFRTVRGYKSWPGMQTGLMMTGTGSD